jgi:hypothetical protein
LISAEKIIDTLLSNQLSRHDQERKQYITQQQHTKGEAYNTKKLDKF